MKHLYIIKALIYILYMVYVYHIYHYITWYEYIIIVQTP